MHIYLESFISLALSFTIVFFIIPKIIKVSLIKNLFDVPNHRSASKRSVPTLGGISILAGFVITTIISANNYNIDELKYMFAGIMVMFIIGMKDDFIGFSARKKFVFQLITAVYLVVLGHYRITNLHGLFSIHEISYSSGVIISVIIFVGIINAVNLIDGIDGLASGVGILISAAYGIWFLYAGDFVDVLVCGSLAGSLAAFFLYNVFGKTNKIFMGDTGSLILGIVVGGLTIHFNELTVRSNLISHGMPAVSLAIVIVPVIDTLRVMAIRIADKRSPFSPDMNHIHHDLIKLTGNHLNASLIIISVNALLILIALNTINILGNNILFLLLLIAGFFLANVPSWILKQHRQVIKESRID